MKPKILLIHKYASRLWLVVCMFLVVTNSYAQDRTVSGFVTDEAGATVPGVNVVEKGTTKGAITDQDGKFTLQVSDNSILVFSFVGYRSKEVIVGQQSQISVTIDPDVTTLSEVIVTGYTTEKRADLTGAVAVVKMKDLVQESTTNVLTGLQGRVPGVEITSTGNPGGGSTAIRIRGISTVGNNNPLFVIDGVPTDNMGPLNPNDIESMQVLKDAASASIYGSRANNGVVIITTKKGLDPTPRITLDAFVGTQNLRNRFEMLNAEEWGQVYWQAQRNSGIASPAHAQYGNGPQPVIPEYIDAAQTIPSADTDWIDEVFRPAKISSYNLGISQATDKSSFYAGLGYAKDEGIQVHTNYDRFSTRLNSTYTIKKRITIGENLQVAYFRQVQGNRMHDAILQHPLIPVYDNLGNFAGPTDGLGDKLNPVGMLNFARDNRSHNWRIFGNAFVGAELVKGLKINSSLGIDYNANDQRLLEPRYKMGRFVVAQNFVTNNFGKNLNLTWSNTLNFTKTFGSHDINAVGGIESVQFNSESFSARREGFLLDNIDFNYLGAGTGIQTVDGLGTEWGLFSQFAKVSYSFQDKYLLSATVRRDGSSRFSESNRYGIFPAVSAGWRISNEKFMSSIKQLDDLKLRASWGRTGNQQISDFGTNNIYITHTVFGGYDLAGANTAITPGYYRSTMGNPNIKWESQEQLNFGIDLGMLNNRLGATVDYFVKNTDGMLLNPLLLAAYGGGSAPFLNAGKMKNSGIEVLLTYRDVMANDFKYAVDFNIATYRNEVVDLGAQKYILGNEGNRIEPGHPVSSFYGFVADGLFRTQEEVDNSATQTGKGLGRIRYKDITGDGLVNNDDRTYIGNPNPKFNYGMNLSASYKGLDLAVFFSGVYGNEIYNWARRLTDFAYFPFNFGKETLDAWSPENPDSDIPSVNVVNQNDELRISSYFVEDGSYLKLKSIVIGYSINPLLLQRLGIEKTRFYVQGQNLFVFTKYKGMDPEIGVGSPFNLGIDFNSYPHSKSVNLGINFTF